jgi:hypothetical protein
MVAQAAYRPPDYKKINTNAVHPGNSMIEPVYNEWQLLWIIIPALYRCERPIPLKLASFFDCIGEAPGAFSTGKAELYVVRRFLQ